MIISIENQLYNSKMGNSHSDKQFAGQEASINRHIGNNRQEYNNLKRSGFSDIQIKGKLRQKHNGST